MITFGFILLAVASLGESQLGFANLPRWSPRLDGRIVGGFDLDIRQAPYQVSLRTQGYHICGGSIIGKDWVLSAAHCLVNASPTDISFRSGATNIDGDDGSIHNAVRIIIHENYNRQTMDFDFALVQVEQPFRLGEPGVEAATLTSTEPTSGWMLASGWGATSSGGSGTDQLQGVYVHIVPREECNEKYQGYYGISSRMICAADTEKDSCQGDSGGPLFNLENKELVGVVSWGVGCADARYPGVYSNIANQRTWIVQNTGIEF